MQLRSSRAIVERRIALLLAALTLFVWPAAFWHQATTVHEVCAEHGELVDVPSACADDGVPGAAAADPDEHEGDHEHCPFASLAQPSAPVPEARDAGVRRVEVALAPHRGSESAFAPIPILSRAPKQSPPA